jgi:altronate dehydratase small subunit
LQGPSRTRITSGLAPIINTTTKEAAMKKSAQALALNAKDNVATALAALDAGHAVAVEVKGNIDRVKLLSPIPMGHKFALADMETGQPVIKYGEPIGRATARISRGEHVHVHNVKGGKGRAK